MSVAIAQAANLKRGHEFQSISEHLVRKTSHGKVQMTTPGEMVRTMQAASRGSGSSVKEATDSHPTRGGFNTVQKDPSKTDGSLLAHSFTSETTVLEACSEDCSGTISPYKDDSGIFSTGSCSEAAAQEMSFEAETDFSSFDDCSYNSGSPGSSSPA